jgi:hypothetical protein
MTSPCDLDEVEVSCHRVSVLGGPIPFEAQIFSANNLAGAHTALARTIQTFQDLTGLRPNLVKPNGAVFEDGTVIHLVTLYKTKRSKTMFKAVRTVVDKRTGQGTAATYEVESVEQDLMIIQNERKLKPEGKGTIYNGADETTFVAIETDTWLTMIYYYPKEEPIVGVLPV